MHKRIITANEANQRLDKFLHKYLPKAEKSFIYKMLRKKNITLNGKKANGREKVIIGDEVTFFLSEDTIKKFQSSFAAVDNYYEAFEKMKNIERVFENEHLLVVGKPVGLLCQKAKPSDYSINEWLIGYLLKSEQIKEESLKTFKPSILNRLDRNTGGLVLCGKTLYGSQEISRLIKENELKKYYQLLVKGQITDGGELKGYLLKDEKANKVKVVNGFNNFYYSKKGAEVLTEYKPLKNYSEYTLIEAKLVTGKTHQIRAHFAAIGHPLVGDYKYGDREFNDKYKRLYGVESQLLHAYRVCFPLLTGELADLSEAEIIAPLPEIFAQMGCNKHLKYDKP
ncbi:MAG: RluA family pseudouridine synthase [Lachnospiraceae bacterium]|nr:RluA family pseudouridine synthase [Lachnospiraceae bacterium]